jgi:hypothetical protein
VPSACCFTAYARKIAFPRAVFRLLRLVALSGGNRKGEACGADARHQMSALFTSILQKQKKSKGIDINRK